MSSNDEFSAFGDMYGALTQQTIRSVGEYGRFDIEAFGQMVQRKRVSFTPFSALLFRQMLTSYPCQRLAQLTDIVFNAQTREQIVSEGHKIIPKTRWEDWKLYVSENDIPEPKYSSTYVSAFLSRQCRGKEKLCKTCSCRRPIIDFFNSVNPAGVESRLSERNLSNWLSGKNVPSDRRTYIELCYALNLRVFPADLRSDRSMDANRFLCFHCNQNPLHVSNPEEAVHYFCLLRPEGKPAHPNRPYDQISVFRNAESIIEKLNSAHHAKKRSPQHGSNRNFTANYCCALENLSSTKDLISYISQYISGEEEYFSARNVVGYFLDDFRQCIIRDINFRKSESDDSSKCRIPVNEARPKPEQRLNAKTSKAVVSSLINFDITEIDRLDVIGLLRKYTISDILYTSDMLEPIASDYSTMIPRGLLMLVVLALNYAVTPIPDIMELDIQDDFSEAEDFTNFVRLFNNTLQGCSMPPLNPNLPFDYCLIYAYYLMRQDSNLRYMNDCVELNATQPDEPPFIDSLTHYLCTALETVITELKKTVQPEE